MRSSQLKMDWFFHKFYNFYLLKFYNNFGVKKLRRYNPTSLYQTDKHAWAMISTSSASSTDLVEFGVRLQTSFRELRTKDTDILWTTCTHKQRDVMATSERIYLDLWLYFFRFPAREHLNVTGHLFARARLASAKLDVARNQLVSTCSQQTTSYVTYCI